MAKTRHNIGLLISNISDPFSNAVASGAMEAAKELDENLIIFPGKYLGIQDRYDKYDTAYEYQYNVLFSYAAAANLDYLIIATGTITYALDKYKVNDFVTSFKNTPLLSLNSKVAGFDYLQFDNRSGIHDAVDYLVKHGRKHICIMAGNLENDECVERFEAYKEALEKNGLEYRSEFLSPCDLSGDCRNDVERLLDRNPTADAILCANDNIAATVFEALKSRGLIIGRDVAVIGFDDLEYSAEMYPPLSSIKADAYGLGKQALAKASSYLNNGHNNDSDYPTEFIPRASSENEVFKSRGFERLKYDEKKQIREYYENKINYSNIFIRDTLNFGGDLKYSYARMMKQISLMGANTAFIYTLKEPVSHDFRESYDGNKEWIFRSYTYGRASQIVPENENNLTTAEVFNNKYLNINRQHCFVAADLFTADMQYGLALLEPASPAFFEDYELVNYQLSSAVRTLDILNKQANLVEELHAKNLVLEDMTKNDAMTGVFNRRGFYLSAEAMITSAPSSDHRYIICYAEMNDLSEINNKYGQAEGDVAIKMMVGMMKTVFDEGAIIGRMGSSEFAAFLPKDKDKNLDYYIERKMTYLSVMNDSGSSPFEFNVNMGLTEYTCRNSYDLKAAMDKADGLLFVDKEIKKRKLVFND